MALIICKNCGKKVSDTVDECIHCGKSPKKLITFYEENISEEINQAEEIEEVKKIEEAEENDFDYYSAYDKKRLEYEFISEDKWAKKYKVSLIELPLFRRSFFIYFCFAYMVLYFLVMMCDFLTGEVENKAASIVTVVSACALVILTLGMFVYSIIKGIYFKISHSRLIYLKRFQRWLNQRNISYIPSFEKVKEARIFESIELD